VKTASEMTYTVSSGALNSTQTKTKAWNSGAPALGDPWICPPPLPTPLLRRQWRSQECELGASPPLPPPSPPLPPPLPLLTGVRGIIPENFRKLKVLVGEF